MNKKVLVVIAVVLSILIAVPVFSIVASRQQPKVMFRIEVPLEMVEDSGTTEKMGDKVRFKDVEWVAADPGVSIRIFQWVPAEEYEEDPLFPGTPHTHVEPENTPIWSITHRYLGGTLEATAHGIRDRYTSAGEWHMDFTITFVIEDVESGFKFSHDCTGVGLVHAATVNGKGFGAFEGIKIKGVSIADLMVSPVTKKIWAEATSGFDNLPSRNFPSPPY